MTWKLRLRSARASMFAPFRVANAISIRYLLVRDRFQSIDVSFVNKSARIETRQLH